MAKSDGEIEVTVTPATGTGSLSANRQWILGGLILGLFFQGAGAGQVVGPVLFGVNVDYYGSWNAAPLVFHSRLVSGRNPSVVSSSAGSTTTNSETVACTQ